MKKSALALSVAAISLSLSVPHEALAQVEELVVTARKRDETYVDVPVTATVFTAQEIEDSGIENPSDFIGLTPNVTLVQTQNAGNSFVTARGISQNRNSEMSVAVMVDGVLMVNPAQFNQELFDVEQIEVLKGPQGALYGRNAIGGAIIINTQQPTDEMQGQLSVGVDNGPGWRARGMISGPVGDSDTLKFRASISAKDTDGYIDNPYLGEEADPYRDISGRLRFMWDPNESFSGDFRFYRSLLDTQALYYNIRSPLPADQTFPWHFTGTTDSVNDTSLPVRVNNPGVNERDITSTSLKLDWYYPSGASFTSISSYDTLKELLTGDGWDFLPRDESALEFLGFGDQNQSQYYDIEAWSQEFRFTSSADQPLRWIAGTYMVGTDRFVSTGNMVDTGGGVFPVYKQPRGNFPFDFATDPVNPQATFLADGQDNFAWAVFGELAYDVSEALELAFSLRYDKDTRENTTLTPTAFIPVVPGFPSGVFGERRKQTWDDWQPKFTIRYKPQDNISYYGSISHGFRSGGFNQTGVGPIAAANGFAGVGDTFDSEEVDTYEVGMKGQFLDGRMRLNTSLYHSVAEGTYFFIFLAANSTQNLGNLKEVEYTGLEVDMVYNMTDTFDMNLALGVTDSEITDSDTPDDIGDRAPNVSDYTFNFGGHYHQPISLGTGMEFFTRVEYQIIGETAFFDREQPDTNDRDAVHLLDLRIGVEVPDDWSLTLWGKNALDEEYNAEYSTGGFVFKAPPARWGIDYTKRF